MNDNLGEFDKKDELSLIANAVYFDMDVLVVEVLRRFPSFNSLMIDDIIRELMSDKQISEEEAADKLNKFTIRYYNQEIDYVPKSNT